MATKSSLSRISPPDATVPLDLYGLTAITGEAITTFHGSYQLPKDEVQINLIRLPAGRGITTIHTFIQTAGSGSPGSPGFQGFAVYDSSGSRIGVTTTDNTLFTSTGWRSKALASAITATAADRWLYLAVLSNLPTGPVIKASLDLNSATFLAGPAGTQRRAFFNGSITATPSSFTVASYGTNDSTLTFMGAS